MLEKEKYRITSSAKFIGKAMAEELLFIAYMYTCQTVLLIALIC
jgi:hypothetical protein